MPDFRLSPFYWKDRYSITVVIFIWILFTASYILYGEHIVEFYWMISAFFIVIIYFFGVSFFQRNWCSISPTRFANKLFFTSFVIHLIVMLILVWIAFLEPNWPELEYVGANDAETYNRQASEIAALIRAGNFSQIFPTLNIFYGSIDNFGVPLIVGFVYAIFGDHIIVGKLFFVLVASGSVVLVYKITQLLWEEQVARLASIMWMLFPYSLFWGVVIRKEALVLFCVLLVSYLVTKMFIRNEFKFGAILLTIISLVAIFYMRTVAGVMSVATIAMMMLLNQFKGSRIAAVTVGVGAIAALLISLLLVGDLQFYFDRLMSAEEVFESRIRNAMRGNSLADIAGLPIFLVLSWIAPFSGMVFIDSATHNVSHSHRHYLMGGLIIWNMIALIGVYGLWRVIKDKPSETVMIWAFAIGYTIALGLTALFTSIRHPYIAMPFQMILIAVGYTYLKNKQFVYVSFIVGVLLVLAWNIFRAAGRGGI